MRKEVVDPDKPEVFIPTERRLTDEEVVAQFESANARKQ